jgi:hypothetical protein
LLLALVLGRVAAFLGRAPGISSILGAIWDSLIA